MAGFGWANLRRVAGAGVESGTHLLPSPRDLSAEALAKAEAAGREKQALGASPPHSTTARSAPLPPRSGGEGLGVGGGSAGPNSNFGTEPAEAPPTPNPSPPRASARGGRGEEANESSISIFKQPDVRGYSFAISPQICARFASNFGLLKHQRAWGDAGRPMRRSLACEVVVKKCTRVFTAVAPESPGIPARNGFTDYT
jgi:hypothetical protein